MNAFKKSFRWKDKNQEKEAEKTPLCQFCGAPSIAQLGKTYFCGSNDCSTQLWADKEKPKAKKPKKGEE